MIKKMKAWLKGGLIGLVVFLIAVVLQLTAVSEEFTVTIMLIFFLGENIFHIGQFIFAGAIYFIIGAIIGWLIGKFKNRNQTAVATEEPTPQ